MGATQGTGTVVRIEAMPAVVYDRMLDSLSEEGIDGTVVATDACFEIRVLDAEVPSLARRVNAALDRLALSEHRSLVPEQVGPVSFVLRPAAG
jgi:hypothetical protein